MRFPVVLETLSPLAVSRSRATGNQLETLRHIPGTMWRGALAAAWIRDHGLGEDAHRDPAFSAFFLTGAVHFGDLRIEGARPWPLSTRVCKLEENDHPKHDFLAGGRMYECPVEGCGAKLAAPSGYYSSVRSGYETRSVPVRVTAHTAISASTLRIRPEQFFTTEVIEARERFAGYLWTLNEAAETTARELVAASDRFITIGRGATRGQGHASLWIDEPTQRQPSLYHSLRELNKVCGAARTVVFTCTLLSPCLVYDEWLLARSYLEVQDIAEAAGLDSSVLAGYTLCNWHSRMTILSGWNARAGLPKADFHAIAAGSAFLFAKDVDEPEREIEMRRIAAILDGAGAVGERCEEGLGEVVFCAEIHYRLQRMK